MAVQTVFERHEKKYLLSQRQFFTLYDILQEHFQVDEYGRHTICSLYYDTPDFACARSQAEKPVYRQKLRLRSYGVPQGGSTVYMELKKKLDGVTYKRRFGLPLDEARRYFADGTPPAHPENVFGEIDWFVRQHRPEAKAVICYDRIALLGRQDPSLRITFDEGIRMRTEQLDLGRGDWGRHLCGSGEVLMEIKVPSALPLWLARALSQQKAFPISFSKYMNTYAQISTGEVARHAG